MDTAELKQLIEQRENSTVEFKERCDQGTIETAAAFANTHGGVILIGVAENREITGFTIRKETLRDVANRISQAIDPRVVLKIESVDVDGKSVLLVHILASPIKPVSVKGICYKRVGNSNRVMSPQEIAQMHLKSVGQTWDQLAVRGASSDDIDEQKIQWYLTQRETSRNVTQSESMDLTDLLKNINCVNDSNIPTHAGILFFGKNPQKFFQNAQLRVVKFRGTSFTRPVSNRLDCSGTLWEIVNVVEEFIRRNIRLLGLQSSKSIQRDDKFEYPLKALREAIINGLIHRNYQEPADVRVFIFDDRVEVINPGSFPEDVSPDRPIHRPVNPILSRLMYDVGFVERYGSGIKMMQRLCEEWENTVPRYELDPLETKVIFDSPIHRTTLLEFGDISDDLSERQKNALFHVEKNGQIAIKEYIELNRVLRGIAYAELKDLTDKGLLSLIGKGRGAKYIRKLSD